MKKSGVLCLSFEGRRDLETPTLKTAGDGGGLWGVSLPLRATASHVRDSSRGRSRTA